MVRYRRAQKQSRIAQRVIEWALEVQLCGALDQNRREFRIGSELLKEKVEIVKVAQAAIEVALVQEMRGAVQQHVGGSENLERRVAGNRDGGSE